jgi:CTP:molybdopterin cytidylyltransferase MocA
MGGPKALLRLGGSTALERVVRALAAGGCEPVVAVLGAGVEEILRKATIPVGVEVTVHDGWERGRTGSLKAGIRAAPDSPAWVVFPVDHPLATADDVRSLVEAWRGPRPPVVRPGREGRGGHPILIDASLVGDLLALGDDEPLRRLVRAHRDREALVEGSPGTLLDLDTPEDLRSIDAGPPA